MKKNIRSLLEKVSRKIVLKRHFRLENKKYPILVSPGSQLKYYGFEFDRDLIDLAEKYVSKGDNVWDIGGNCGTFSFPASVKSSVGQTVIFEPDTWLCELMKKTKSFRQFEKLEINVICSAISENIDLGRFTIANRGRASSALLDFGGRSQMGGTRFNEIVPIFNLDFVAEHFEKPNFIKIDVEGAEIAVLTGAIKVIKDCQPAIYIEVGRETEEGVTHLLHSLNYQMVERNNNNILYLPR